MGKGMGTEQGHPADTQLRTGSTFQLFRTKNLLQDPYMSDYNSKGLSMHKHNASQIPKGFFSKACNIKASRNK